MADGMGDFDVSAVTEVDDSPPRAAPSNPPSAARPTSPPSRASLISGRGGAGAPTASPPTSDLNASLKSQPPRNPASSALPPPASRAGGAPSSAGGAGGQMDFSQIVQAAVLDEAQRIASKLLTTEANSTKIVNVRDPIDQPDKVKAAVAGHLRSLGYAQHPDDGACGSFTLGIEHDLPPDVFPTDLWVRSTHNPGVTGWYAMRESDEGLPVWDRQGEGGQGDDGGGVGGNGSLYAMPSGQWMVGPEAGGSSGWLTSTEKPVNPAMPGMPHTTANWTCYDRATEEWQPTNTASLAVLYVPKSIYLACGPNPALQHTYHLSPTPFGGYPRYVHEENPAVSVFFDEKRGLWMVGKSEQGIGWLTALERVPPTSMLMPDCVRDWMVYNGKTAAWESGAGAVSVARQRNPRSISRVVYHLRQTPEQTLRTIDPVAQGILDAMAFRIGEHVVGMLCDGCARGKMHFDEVVNLQPLLEECRSESTGDDAATSDPHRFFALYYGHVLRGASDYIGDNATASTDGVVLSLTRNNADGAPNVLLFQYCVEEYVDEHELERAAAQVVSLYVGGKEGSWVKEFYRVPADRLAERLCEKGLTDFSVAEEVRGGDNGVVVTARVPWSTTRELWDHGEMAGRRFPPPVVAGPEALSRRLSPTRRPAYGPGGVGSIERYDPTQASYLLSHRR